MPDYFKLFVRVEQVIRVPRWFMQISKTLEIFLGYVFFPQVFFSIGAVLISTEVILYYIMEFLGNLPKIFSFFFFFFLLQLFESPLRLFVIFCILS